MELKEEIKNITNRFIIEENITSSPNPDNRENIYYNDLTDLTLITDELNEIKDILLEIKQFLKIIIRKNQVNEGSNKIYIELDKNKSKKFSVYLENESEEKSND